MGNAGSSQAFANFTESSHLYEPILASPIPQLVWWVLSDIFCEKIHCGFTEVYHPSFGVFINRHNDRPRVSGQEP